MKIYKSYILSLKIVAGQVRLLVAFIIIFFSLNVVSQEICDNGIEDDLDGYIDMYDEDCDCGDEYFQAQCEQDCVDTTTQEIKMSLKWKTEVLNHSEGYSLHPFSVFENYVYINSHKTITEGVQNSLLKLNLANQNIVNEIILDTLNGPFTREFLVQKDNPNDSVQIISHMKFTSLSKYSTESGLIWSNSSSSTIFNNLRHIKSADINENGDSEFYTGNALYSSSGNLLYKGDSSEGCNFITAFNMCSLGPYSVAADFTDHDGLELACGNVLYEIDINNSIDSVGNTANVITAPAEVREGNTTFADFDGDGRPEIVSSRSNTLDDGGIWIWNPRDQSLLSSVDHSVGIGMRGGIPTIADFNNDCLLDIAIIYQNDLRVYSYDGTSELKLLYNIADQDESGFTATTAFDLNSDGWLELISRDEDFIYVFDGATGILLDSFAINSVTGYEQPIITDTDNDGHAEILIQGSDTHPDSMRLFCFESANRPWAPARRVWNQSGYHVTNVNDDLTIPQYQQNSAAFFDSDSCYLETCPQVYNTFGVQATYRTQEGCAVLPERDVLPVEIIASQDTICLIDSVLLSIITDENDIQWYTDEADICPGCDSLTISLDTTSWVRVVVGDDICFVEDSILIIVREPVEYTETSSICAGDSILFDNVYRTENGLYTRSVGACDSIITLELSVIDSVSESISRTFCQGDSVIIENEIFKDEGTYQVSTFSSIGCDSIINLTITHHLPTTKDSMITICDGDSIFLEGLWYDEDDLVSISESNTMGCDSTTFFTIELVDILSNQDTIQICEGDSLILHGAWESMPGDYSDMFPSASGCDSVFTYHLIVQDTSIVNIAETICVGDTLLINGEIFTEATTYAHTVLSSTLCDSTIHYTISLSELPTRLIDLSICEGDSILLDGQWITEAGTYEVVSPNENTCDSVLTYQVTVSDYLMSSQEISRCEGDTIFLVNTSYTTNTTITDTVSGIQCDTIRTININFSPALASTTALEYCQADTFVTSLDTLTNSGTAQEIFTSVDGCDSIVTYEVTFIPRSIQDSNHFICAGDSIFLVDRYYYDAVSFTEIFDGAQCDSVINYILTVYDTDTTYQEHTITEGESITINNEEYQVAGEYVQSITTASSCDSTLIITIIVEASTDLMIPNIFSPNGDKINDVMEIYMTDFPNNEFIIYDRWGNLVFTSTNQEVIAWDGMMNGAPVSDGVYVYILRYGDNDGEMQRKIGDLTVIR